MDPDHFRSRDPPPWSEGNNYSMNTPNPHAATSESESENAAKHIMEMPTDLSMSDSVIDMSLSTASSDQIESVCKQRLPETAGNYSSSDPVGPHRYPENTSSPLSHQHRVAEFPGSPTMETHRMYNSSVGHEHRIKTHSPYLTERTSIDDPVMEASHFQNTPSSDGLQDLTVPVGQRSMERCPSNPPTNTDTFHSPSSSHDNGLNEFANNPLARSGEMKAYRDESDHSQIDRLMDNPQNSPSPGPQELGACAESLERQSDEDDDAMKDNEDIDNDQLDLLITEKSEEQGDDSEDEDDLSESEQEYSREQRESGGFAATEGLDMDLESRTPLKTETQDNITSEKVIDDEFSTETGDDMPPTEVLDELPSVRVRDISLSDEVGSGEDMEMPYTGPWAKPSVVAKPKVLGEKARILKPLLSRLIVDFCREHLVFIDFVHFTARCSFNIDNREAVHIVTSDMATPLQFGETMLPKIRAAKTGTTKKLPMMTGSKRKRGRPRKSVPTNVESAILQTGPPKEVPRSKRGRPQKTIQDIPLNQIYEGMDPIDDVDGVSKGDKDYEPDQIVETGLDKDDEAIAEKRRLQMERRVLAAESAKLRVDTSVVKTEDMDELEDSVVDAAGVEDEDDYESDGSEKMTEIRKTKKRSRGRPRRKNLSVAAGMAECANCKLLMPIEDLEEHRKTHWTIICTECGEPFRIMSKYRQHARDVHDKDNVEVFTCETCNAKFTSHEQLIKHHDQRHNNICSVCGECFTRASELRVHKEAKHPEMSLTCSKCNRTCSTKGALRKHMARHDETENGHFVCDVCGKSFTAKSTLYHHKRGVHSIVKPYECEVCHKTFNFNHSYKLHKLQHSGLRPYKCEICAKSYLTSSHLKIHIQGVHGTVKKYSCPVCDKSFPYENSFKMHMMLHTGEKPFLCHMCSKGFISRSALKVHEASHVEGKKFECDICHKKYKTEYLLRAHERRHTTDGSRYMCDLCGGRFMYRSNLEQHMLVHSDNRNFTCKSCGKMFKTYATLYSHQLVHTNDNPFNCNMCGKAFKTRERMKSHEKRHSGLKPFCCENCGVCFPDKGGLSKHRKTVHASKARFGCPVCGKRCNRADNLRVHMKVHGDPALLKLSFEELVLPENAPEEAETDCNVQPVKRSTPRRQRTSKLAQYDPNNPMDTMAPSNSDLASDMSQGPPLTQPSLQPTINPPFYDNSDMIQASEPQNLSDVSKNESVGSRMTGQHPHHHHGDHNVGETTAWPYGLMLSQPPPLDAHSGHTLPNHSSHAAPQSSAGLHNITPVSPPSEQVQHLNHPVSSSLSGLPQWASSLIQYHSMIASSGQPPPPASHSPVSMVTDASAVRALMSGHPDHSSRPPPQQGPPQGQDLRNGPSHHQYHHSY